MEDVVILTGGAGFIGSRLAQRLVGGSHRVIAIDNMHPQVHQSSSRPANLPADVELVVADVTDRDFWDGFLSRYRPREVVHLAAETGTGQSLTESTRHSHVNVVGTTQMLDGFARHKRIPEHIVLTSSRAVYGEGAWLSAGGTTFYPSLRDHATLARGVWDIIGADGEAATPILHSAATVFPKPASIYGATKLAQEQIVASWSSAMGVPATIFRFQNVYGPGQSPYNSYTGIITLFHRIARQGGVIEVYEDGLIGRDFVYVDDVVDTCVAALRQPPAETRYLDVGTGDATTILDAAILIAAIHKAPQPVVSGKFRDGDIRWAVADTKRLASELGLSCKTRFADYGAQRVGEWLASESIV